MKRILFPIVAAGASLLTISAHAADGQINFEGELFAQTCLIDVDGDTGNPAIVTLAKVATAGLQTAGATAAQRNFNINLKNCIEAAGGRLLIRTRCCRSRCR
ncbi:fimbrial protein [Variovorax sp. Sphag1AA]|uniref:fimbrial protein n=1 Tax=Variovorax sp. Sphag1AA TaxID=2587027 RepID=UPI00161958A6|nr:type 1 fimbrial protein [Variovorax sp. Sphag1AA]MBB3175827.1 type 1 fimbria pilin [Variovorax sp. Sphag1AA]